ncbi:hypothetical protein WOLCODRAFT_24692 [Wolfiporia cocos MD-104 SS10]|uniref:Uncharacterized protein n=1 Tax=Wolfiporia cocos (strain MD-104) TaxID=742152 RepID=A0A2H3JIJ7_WOLCO|nr:hypothetical protein WOLCODRAFT_24692 [Wolfiporia cocos MD-104 SS10]
MAKKKGPPYEDDPECKYIVIEDPWPGKLHGKARDAPYWRWLGAWVYFMLGKNAAPENTYSVNTRAEVIVKLPEHVDITPILGAHRWRQFLYSGDPRDVQRVSYIFEYNYRLKGEPERHNWESHEPVGSFEPPPNLGCPVKFPYPSPHWASLDGRNCRDLARSLPASRVRTPTPPPHSPPQKSAPPPPSLYEPYQTPAHLTSIREEQSGYRYDDDEQGSGEARSALQPPVAKFANKLDPYEEEDAALRLVKSEPTEPNLGLASAKEEPSDFHVKLESTDLSIKSEPTDRLVKINEPPAPARPSEAMVAAFEQWQRAQVGQASSAPLSADPGNLCFCTGASTC